MIDTSAAAVEAWIKRIDAVILGEEPEDFPPAPCTIEDFIRALAAERDAAQSELAKLRAEAEWRPIESAPRDGTYIMACEPIENDFMQYVCAWSAAEFVDLEAPTRKLRNGWMVNGCDELDPTHWRPNPSPPKDPAHD